MEGEGVEGIWGQVWRGIRDPHTTCSKPWGDLPWGSVPLQELHSTEDQGAGWGAAPFQQHLEPTCSSPGTQAGGNSAAGNRKAHHSLPLSSRGMRWLPRQRSPGAWEAGLWLCEEHPGLQAGRPGASPTPNNTHPRPPSCPFPGSGAGAGGGQGTDVYPHQTPPPAPFSNKFLSYSQLWSFLFGPVSNV